MEVDGAWADEQLRRHLAVRHSLRNHGGDLQFLRGQARSLGGLPLADRLAGRPQLLADPLSPRPGAEVVEHGERGP